MLRLIWMILSFKIRFGEFSRMDEFKLYFHDFELFQSSLVSMLLKGIIFFNNYILKLKLLNQ